MRTWEEIFNKHLHADFDKNIYPNGYPYIELAMKEYVKEAIIECAERARLKIGHGHNPTFSVDKDTILSLIDELK